MCRLRRRVISNSGLPPGGPEKIRALSLILGLLISVGFNPAEAQLSDTSATFDRDSALAHSQAAIGQQVAGFQFTDSRGNIVNLEKFRGRPLVLSMIFTSCYHTCPLLTKNLEKTVQIARDALGENSFDVVTVGFDWQADTPSRMASYAAEMGIQTSNWWFLSASQLTVKELSEDLGFLFLPTSRGFDHLAQTTVIDRDGKVFWQIYGAEFGPPQLVEPLKRLVFDRREDPLSLSAWIEGVKFFCTVYDPASGRYRFNYSIVIAFLAGVMSLGAVAIFILRSWRQSS